MDNNFLTSEDPNLPVSGYLASQGAAGLLENKLNKSPEKYHPAVKKGHKKIHDYVSSLFSGTKNSSEDNSKSKKKIEDWLDKGSTHEEIQQELANQDNIEPSIMNAIHPQQNLLLQAAKGRVSSYLNALKPQKNLPKLAFDDEPDQTEKQRSFNKALNIANEPLSVLDHVNEGTIEPEHIQHFNSMFPELNDHLQKKLTDHIINAQLKNEKPSYKVRQGLSLFMGTDLSGEFTPQNMQAAQAVFQNQQMQQQQQLSPQVGKTKNRKNTSTLSKSSQAFLTGNQSLVSRQQKQS